MNSADEMFFVSAFTIVSILLAAVRSRLKRVEKKLDELVSESTPDDPKSTLL